MCLRSESDSVHSQTSSHASSRFGIRASLNLFLCPANRLEATNNGYTHHRWTPSTRSRGHALLAGQETLGGDLARSAAERRRFWLRFLPAHGAPRRVLNWRDVEGRRSPVTGV